MMGALSLPRCRWVLNACSISSVNFTYALRLESLTGFRSYMPLKGRVKEKKDFAEAGQVYCGGQASSQANSGCKEIIKCGFHGHDERPFLSLTACASGKIVTCY